MSEDHSAPLIISGAPRSGTTLLYNLFDGHPEISWLVTEGYFFEYVYDCGLENASVFTKLASGGVDQLIDGIRDRAVLPQLHENYRQVFAGTMQTSQEYQINWDEAAFRAHLEEDNFSTIEALWNTLSQACLAGLGQSPRRYICLKSPDYGKSAFAALSNIQTAKAVVIVRDPVMAIDSLKYGRAIRQEKVLSWPTLAITIANYKRFHHELLNQDKNRISVVVYEDLVKDPETAMRRVADKLDLEFDPCLIVPSFMGQSWGGHSTHRVTTGIDANLADRSLKSLTMNEVEVIEAALHDFRSSYGYIDRQRS